MLILERAGQREVDTAARLRSEETGIRELGVECVADVLDGQRDLVAQSETPRKTQPGTSGVNRESGNHGPDRIGAHDHFARLSLPTKRVAERKQPRRRAIADI